MKREFNRLFACIAVAFLERQCESAVAVCIDAEYSFVGFWRIWPVLEDLRCNPPSFRARHADPGHRSGLNAGYGCDDRIEVALGHEKRIQGGQGGTSFVPDFLFWLISSPASHASPAFAASHPSPASP